MSQAEHANTPRGAYTQQAPTQVMDVAYCLPRFNTMLAYVLASQRV